MKGHIWITLLYSLGSRVLGLSIYIYIPIAGYRDSITPITDNQTEKHKETEII